MFKFDQRVALKLNRPHHFLFLYAALIFLILCLVLEMVARTPFVQHYAPYQAYGTNHTQLEIELTILNKYVHEHGAPDCFIFGSSQAFRDIDPETFAQSFEANGGERLNCFNFGITGSQVSTTAILNKMLAEEYKPRLVVIGTSFLDYTEGRELQIDERFKNNDWLEYKLGKFSINGWLMDHSYAWRFITLASYAAPYRMNFMEVLREAHKWDGEIAQNGFALSQAHINPLLPMDTGFVKNMQHELGNYSISERNQTALDQIVTDSQSVGAQVVIAELMYHPSLLDLKDYKGQPRMDRQKTLAFQDKVNMLIQNIAQKHGILYLETDPNLSIPKDGWFDLYHLNRIGAEVFSQWLGAEAAQKIEALPPSHSDQGN